MNNKHTYTYIFEELHNVKENFSITWFGRQCLTIQTAATWSRMEGTWMDSR